MINEQGGHKVLEIFNIENLWGRLEKEFKLPMVAQSVEYQTSQGSFTVQVDTSERSTREVVLLYEKSRFTYYNPNCHHNHDGKEVTCAKGEGQFCKSKMKVTYKDGASFDCLTTKRIDDFVQKFNRAFSLGISWVDSVAYPNILSFMDTTSSGRVGMSTPVELEVKSPL